MDYPKMLYSCDVRFDSEESLKAGLTPGGAVRNSIVADEAEEAEALAGGWTESPADFIGEDKPKRGRKPKAEEPA